MVQGALRLRRAQQRRERAKGSMHKRKARFRCEARTTRGDRGVVAVDCDEAPLRSEGIEYAGAVPAAAERSVDVAAIRAHGKSCKHLVDKHRFVLIQTPRPGAPVAALSERQ